jgi:hypothetical protein
MPPFANTWTQALAQVRATQYASPDIVPHPCTEALNHAGGEVDHSGDAVPKHANTWTQALEAAHNAMNISGDRNQGL